MDIDNLRPVRSGEIPQSPEAVPDNAHRPDDAALPIDPEKIENEDAVDEASDASFPASDPPSHSRSTATTD